ncbi:MAG: hypothetical protein CVU05_14120 [Bacteroidetes bacterium HGW-Bacteroidetes-21]|jgi:F420-0:gamma-glutamyl ligase|nr:MAG: hypothetical protein CVU05_14120 [Bacteroidetes bacterium HGW-Bacteroidetes-21]
MTYLSELHDFNDNDIILISKKEISCTKTDVQKMCILVPSSLVCDEHKLLKREKKSLSFILLILYRTTVKASEIK